MDNLVTLGLVERLKNSHFILKMKMAELIQHQISSKPNQPDVA